jgi:hypothetical protein
MEIIAVQECTLYALICCKILLEVEDVSTPAIGTNL